MRSGRSSRTGPLVLALLDFQYAIPSPVAVDLAGHRAGWTGLGSFGSCLRSPLTRRYDQLRLVRGAATDQPGGALRVVAFEVGGLFGYGLRTRKRMANGNFQSCHASPAAPAVDATCY